VGKLFSQDGLCPSCFDISGAVGEHHAKLLFGGSPAAGKKKIDGRDAVKEELTEIGKQRCFFTISFHISVFQRGYMKAPSRKLIRGAP
jgi:hypothetical protein